MILKSSFLLLTIFSISNGFPRTLDSEKNENFQLVILHNNDMHARFEQTNVFSSVCSKDEAANNQCYGGFSRIAYL